MKTLISIEEKYITFNSNRILVKKTYRTQNIWMLIPLFGTYLFAYLYFVATLFYPGGSQADKNSKGFSWANNYWCNLLNENALNGEHNSARPVALASIFVLCLTLGTFWYLFPQQVDFKKSNRLAIQISGIVSMIIGVFIFTRLHDSIINISGFFALIAIIGTFAGLLKLRWTGLFWLGIFNLLLVAANNVLYYGEDLKLYLPVVQKITFVFFLLWICLIDIRLYKRKNLKFPV